MILHDFTCPKRLCLSLKLVLYIAQWYITVYAQDPDTEGDELHCAHCDAVFTSQAVLYKHIQNQSRPVKSPSKNNVYCNKMMEDEYTDHKEMFFSQYEFLCVALALLYIWIAFHNNHMANFSLSQPHLYEGSGVLD
jgi:hypothetical protein